MRSSLVTGGAGFIGSHLVDALAARGDRVRVLDDFSTGKRANLAASAAKVEVIEGCLTDPDAVGRAVAGVDTVFHLGALPSVQRSVEAPLTTHEVCATGTLRVLDAARRAGVRRVVYAASSSAYGDTPGVLRRETDPISPMSPYAVAKVAGEHYCNAFTTVYGLETVRLRFFNIFGPRQDPLSPYSGVIAKFTRVMKAGQRPVVHGDGQQSRDFTYVENAVRGLLLAADAPAAVRQVYNLGSGGRVSLLELVEQINAALGTRLEPEFGPARAGDVRHSQADLTRARADLGYEPVVSFPEGLRRTLDTVTPG